MKLMLLASRLSVGCLDHYAKQQSHPPSTNCVFLTENLYSSLKFAFLMQNLYSSWKSAFLMQNLHSSCKSVFFAENLHTQSTCMQIYMHTDCTICTWMKV